MSEIQEIIKNAIENSAHGYILRDGFYQKTEEYIEKRLRNYGLLKSREVVGEEN